MDNNEYFKSNEEILAAFKIVLPYINKITHDDMVVGLTDLEKYIGCANANEFELDLYEGKSIKGMDNVQESIRYKKEILTNVPEEVYGRKIKTIFTPIYGENNEVIGTLSSGIDFANNNKLVESVAELSEIVKQVNESTSQVAESAGSLANTGQDSIKMVEELNEKNKDTGKILQLIRDIAGKSNLLGLNAAIESARAGEHGRGFSVVATEVRKLAEQSHESVENIEGILKEMNDTVNNINNSIESVGAISEEQAAATEEILSSIEQITSNVEQLKSFVARYE